MWQLRDLLVHADITACRVTMLGRWAVILDCCTEQKRKCLQKFPEESEAVRVQRGLGWGGEILNENSLFMLLSELQCTNIN